MRRMICPLGLLLLLLVSRTSSGQDSPMDKFRLVEQEYQSAMNEFYQAYGKAKTNEEKQALVQSMPQAAAYAARAMQVAQDHPDDPVAAKALSWIVTNVRAGELADQAINRLIEKHVESPELARVCQMLMYTPSPRAGELLKLAYEKSPHRDVRAAANYSLASKAQGEQAEELFEKLLKDYADVAAGSSTYGKLAERNLYELRFLAIGKTAPEIEGEDIFGKKFKLSDFRGKVVVLDFWGHW